MDAPNLLDHQLCFALYRATRAMTKAYQPILEPLGLTYPQYLVLLALGEESGVSVKRLGERLTLDSGTLTPLLKRMEAAGLVERLRDGEDERVVRIHLTSQGKALHRKTRAVPKALACKVLERVDQRSLAKLGRLRAELEELVCRLDAAG